MRNIVREGPPKVSGWDDPVPANINKEFREVITHLGSLRTITFPVTCRTDDKYSFGGKDGMRSIHKVTRMG